MAQTPKIQTTEPVIAVDMGESEKPANQRQASPIGDMRTKLDCDRPRGEKVAHFLSVFRSDNTLKCTSSVQVLYSLQAL